MSNPKSIDLEDAISIASRRFIPKGVKPEDYLCCSKEIAVRIASLIAIEAQHILNVEVKLYSEEQIRNFKYKIGYTQYKKNRK